MLLQVRELEVGFFRQGIEVPVIKEINLSLKIGHSLALIGESGAGKTVTALAIMGLLATNKAKVRGSIVFEGLELSRIDDQEMAKIRGNRIGYIPQNSANSLTPTLPVGMQIIEGLLLHHKMSFAAARELGIKLLESLGIIRASQFFNAYPHQLSGGMLQRALIAMALSMKPSLLIADEPTSALDVTVQAEVLAIMKQALESHEMGILLITHDLAVAAQLAETSAIYYAGKIIERGMTENIFASPRHPYTKVLLESLWRLEKSDCLEVLDTAGNIRGAYSINNQRGCAYALVCREVISKCLEAIPPYVLIDLHHEVACWKAINKR
jgi:oligopeptide/dipeptide ABC transporter ATP-binding protein